MSIAQTAGAVQDIQIGPFTGEHSQTKRLPRILRWLIEKQKRRAELLIQRHPEWQAQPQTSGRDVGVELGATNSCAPTSAMDQTKKNSR